MMVKTRLMIDVAGATRQDLDRGIAAARAVFIDAGFTPVEAFEALRKHIDEEETLTEREVALCAVWEQADAAALAACCEGWPSVPDITAWLEVKSDRDR